MFSRVIKSKYKPTYLQWCESNNYSILSPRYRGFYAEMIFNKFCQEQDILAIKINQFIPVLDQINTKFLKKTQQKELKKWGKISLNWFIIEENNGYFLEVKMGTSNLSKNQRELISRLKKVKAYSFRVFEDGDVFIKKEN